MSELPDYPWQKVSMDFYGPLPTGHSLLVARDDYSRYPEVDVVSPQSARQVIPAIDKLFASRGAPEVVKSDNGTPFQSSEFKDFSEKLGFTHRRIAPYWPEANGGAERIMRTLDKAVKCAQLEGKPWQKELSKFLRNTSFLKQFTSEPIMRKFDEVIFTEDEAWERSCSFNLQILCIFLEGRNRRF
jgi:transposase InsO family protein